MIARKPDGTIDWQMVWAYLFLGMLALMLPGMLLGMWLRGE